MSSLSTPISELLGDDTQQMPPPHMMQKDPSSQFANPPQMGGDLNNRPVINEIPHGPSQGMSMPKRELFGNIKEFDWKSTLLVFAIALIVTSSIFMTFVRSFGGTFGNDGKITMVGSAIAAVFAVVVYVLIKMLGKF
jgi:hypothetical protein